MSRRKPLFVWRVRCGGDATSPIETFMVVAPTIRNAISIAEDSVARMGSEEWDVWFIECIGEVES